MLRFKFYIERGLTSTGEPVCRFDVWTEITWNVNLIEAVIMKILL